MKTFLYPSLLSFSLALTFSCHSQTIPAPSLLTSQERHWCDSLKIDSSIVSGIRTQTDSGLRPFPLNLEMVLNKDIDVDPKRKQIDGFLFPTSNTNSEKIVVDLYSSFQKKGYTIFFLDRHFGIGNEADILAVLKTTDKYKILKQVQTDGINLDIDNDSLINLIRKFDKKYSLDIVGASSDWCEFKINKAPQNWLTLAKEAYKVCPDIVDQGAGTVEKLAEEMKQTKRLYFWWD